MLVAQGVVVDWECFKKVFLEKYFSKSVRHAKEPEFMRLHQGGMSVSDYAMRFEHLACLYLQAISKAWKCRKFVEGLRQKMKMVVVPMTITEFPALVEKAKVVERLEGGNRVMKTAEGPAGGGRQGGGATLRWYRCAGPYFVRDCPHTESQCFRCHQMGHESTNCPARNRPERGAHRDLVKGKGKATGKDEIILFNSGASHSFIYYACAAMLGVSVCDLGLRLLVSTPASTSLVASELCAGCPIVVNEKRQLIFPQVEEELLISGLSS
ncbi:uncharacterized protein LOC109806985 [Cajanus cajan]|uniref:uncharacterized protein LOC109806985 n=1 Tax=Cajanus cajan TaxID=3821 RepID=UPI00098D9F42|nr:uncharacterized protein LOC109806985 [Cajanus cajan]